MEVEKREQTNSEYNPRIELVPSEVVDAMSEEELEKYVTKLMGSSDK